MRVVRNFLVKIKLIGPSKRDTNDAALRHIEFWSFEPDSSLTSELKQLSYHVVVVLLTSKYCAQGDQTFCAHIPTI